MKKIKGIIVPSHVRSVSDELVPYRKPIVPNVSIYVNARTGNAKMYRTTPTAKNLSTINIYNFIPLSIARFRHVGHSIKFSHQKKGDFPTTIFDIRTRTIGGVPSGICYER